MSTIINTTNNVHDAISKDINSECKQEQLTVENNNMNNFDKVNSHFDEIVDMSKENVINILCTKNRIVHMIEYTDQIEYYNELNKNNPAYKDIRILLEWMVEQINEAIDSAYYDMEYACKLHSSIYKMISESNTTD